MKAITRRDAFRLVPLAAIGLLPPLRIFAQRRSEPNADRDGQALFRGVFFLEGPVVKQVPELDRLSSLAELAHIELATGSRGSHDSHKAPRGDQEKASSLLCGVFRCTSQRRSRADLRDTGVRFRASTRNREG